MEVHTLVERAKEGQQVVRPGCQFESPVYRMQVGRLKWELGVGLGEVLYESNAGVIRDVMAETEAEVHDDYILVPVAEGGEPTDAARRMAELLTRMESYPALDEEDLCRREYEQKVEAIGDAVSGIAFWWARRVEDLPRKVYDWLWTYNQDALEYERPQGLREAVSEIVMDEVLREDPSNAELIRQMGVESWIQEIMENVALYGAPETETRAFVNHFWNGALSRRYHRYEHRWRPFWRSPSGAAFIDCLRGMYPETMPVDDKFYQEGDDNNV